MGESKRIKIIPCLDSSRRNAHESVYSQQEPLVCNQSLKKETLGNPASQGFGEAEKMESDAWRVGMLQYSIVTAAGLLVPAHGKVTTTMIYTHILIKGLRCLTTPAVAR